MKKKFTKLRFPYFFGQQIRSQDSAGQMPELITPESDWQGAKSVIQDILRWADDGGKSLDVRNRVSKSTPDAAEQNNKSEPQQEAQRNANLSGTNDSPSDGS